MRKNGRWAAALRRALEPAGPRVYETRSLPECWQELSRSPASAVLWEVTAQNAERVLRRLIDLARQFPHARALIVGEPATVGDEWTWREAGAVHVITSPQRLAEAVRVTARHLALAPQPSLTLRETLWLRLPWTALRAG